MSDDEVSCLFLKKEFKLRCRKGDVGKELYNEYVCKKEDTCIIHSFLMFLASGKSIPHWVKSNFAPGIIKMLKYPDMEVRINLLLAGESINVTVYDNISINE